jgi:hypothetical protein
LELLQLGKSYLQQLHGLAMVVKLRGVTKMISCDKL